MAIKINKCLQCFSIVIFLSLAIAGVYATGPFAFWKAAEVGSTIIYRNDTRYRDQVVRIYFPEEKRKMGLSQLIMSAYNLEILKNYGVEPTREEVLVEAQGMRAESKDPKMLEKIRQIFGEDEEAYLRAFVLPNLVDHRIYFDFFLRDDRVQSESLQRAEDFIKYAASSKERNFQDLANDKNLRVETLSVSLKKGLQLGTTGL